MEPNKGTVKIESPLPGKAPDPIIINGKQYPMWEGFVHKKKEWIGGELEDLGLGHTVKTQITDITLEANAPDAAYLKVHGKEFNCGGDSSVLGIASSEEGFEGITLSGFGGHTWRISKPKLSH